MQHTIPKTLSSSDLVRRPHAKLPKFRPANIAVDEDEDEDDSYRAHLQMSRIKSRRRSVSVPDLTINLRPVPEDLVSLYAK